MADMDYSCAGVNRTFQHDLATDIWYSWMWMEGLTNPDKKMTFTVMTSVLAQTLSDTSAQFATCRHSMLPEDTVCYL